MASEAIDNESLLGVNSLRSKFEQLAHGNSGNMDALSPPEQRQRALSSTSFSDDAVESSRHIRSSSSSSDLRSHKRPPPPPPPQSSAATAIAARRIPASTPAVTRQSDYVEILEPVEPAPRPTSNLANLKTKFNSPGNGPSLSSNPPSPLQRPVPLPPPSRTRQAESSSSEGTPPTFSSIRSRFSNGTSPGHSPQPSWSSQSSDIPVPSNSNNKIKPAIPPRPASTNPSSPHELIQSPPPITFDRRSDSPSTPPVIPPRPHITAAYDVTAGHLSDTDLPSLSPPYPKASPKIPPPRPPRHKPAAMEETATSLTTAGPASPLFPTLALPPPPPLPQRKPTAPLSPEDAGSPNGYFGNRHPPPLAPPPRIGRPALRASSPTSESRSSLVKSKLLPPPTRTIAPGDKLPARRTVSEDAADEDSSEEEDELATSSSAPWGAKADLSSQLPDTSRSSRRPPFLYFRGHTPKIPIQAYSGAFVVAGGTVVVATNHHIKVYDIMKSMDSPVLVKDTKTISANGKDVKITSMGLKVGQFAATRHGGGSGELVIWVGTKEGHLIELDVKAGLVVTSAKYSAHLHPVTGIWRHREQMITLDAEGGKCCIFGVSDVTGRVELFGTPRIVRIAEKQDFVKFIRGKVWTAAKGESHGSEGGGGDRRVPIIRVFDVLAGNGQRSLLPSEYVGPVTAGCVVPAYPDILYLGHEGGFVSTWHLENAAEGYPKCVETLKVGVSDVLCMEGVSDKLWIGNRSGVVSAYDVSSRPWVMTNSWKAHPGVPVVGLAVDIGGLVQDMQNGGGRLGVVSWGRDDVLRIWDGLLEVDWIETELQLREESFSTFRDLKVLHASWNVDSARPDSLAGDPANISLLADVLTSTSNPDIIVFGLQEVVDLENRKLAAKNVILGGLRKAGGSSKDDLAYGSGAFDEKATGAYKRWHEALLLAVRAAMPPDLPYAVVHMEGLVGLFTCIFVKKTERMAFKDLSVVTVKRGMGGRYGNKGAILARLVIDDSSICFVNCHLAAGQNSVRQRGADVASIMESTKLAATVDEHLAYVGGGDGTMVLDHEIVFVGGDMNYRLDARREAIISAINEEDFESLQSHDQLLREMKLNKGFRFRGFAEGPLDFAPTYKYDRRTDVYDTSEKGRSPAWCDRILWRSLNSNRIRQEHYARYEANVSDHRPISAAFSVTIKKVRQDVRHQVKQELENLWVEEQARSLELSRDFYTRHYLI